MKKLILNDELSYSGVEFMANIIYQVNDENITHIEVPENWKLKDQTWTQPSKVYKAMEFLIELACSNSTLEGVNELMN